MSMPANPISLSSAAGPSMAESGGFTSFGSVTFREKQKTDYVMIGAFLVSALGAYLLWKNR